MVEKLFKNVNENVVPHQKNNRFTWAISEPENTMPIIHNWIVKILRELENII